MAECHLTELKFDLPNDLAYLLDCDLSSVVSSMDRMHWFIDEPRMKTPWNRKKGLCTIDWINDQRGKLKLIETIP